MGLELEQNLIMLSLITITIIIWSDIFHRNIYSGVKLNYFNRYKISNIHAFSENVRFLHDFENAKNFTTFHIWTMNDKFKPLSTGLVGMDDVTKTNFSVYKYMRRNVIIQFMNSSFCTTSSAYDHDFSKKIFAFQLSKLYGIL